ncbi:MAG: DUF2269 domain-containing protein [Anaerolineae bacterium]|nr:DUF2269 domain-containing protein [Anaerolineae bacterium]
MNYLNRANLRLLGLSFLLAVILSLPFPFYTRQWHKFMHVVGAVLFIGNIVVTAAWMFLAERTQKPAVVHFAAKAVNQADLLFTIPGVLLIFINGLILAPAFGGGNILGASWVVVALILLALSGIVWGGFLLRYQHQLVQLSASGENLSPAFAAVFRRWVIWGVIATILPIFSLVLMVFKPTLWG